MQYNNPDPGQVRRIHKAFWGNRRMEWFRVIGAGMETRKQWVSDASVEVPELSELYSSQNCRVIAKKEPSATTGIVTLSYRVY